VLVALRIAQIPCGTRTSMKLKDLSEGPLWALEKLRNQSKSSFGIHDIRPADELVALLLFLRTCGLRCEWI
jgi:hypothetical protein